MCFSFKSSLFAKLWHIETTMINTTVRKALRIKSVLSALTGKLQGARSKLLMTEKFRKQTKRELTGTVKKEDMRQCHPCKVLCWTPSQFGSNV